MSHVALSRKLCIYWVQLISLILLYSTTSYVFASCSRNLTIATHNLTALEDNEFVLFYPTNVIIENESIPDYVINTMIQLKTTKELLQYLGWQYPLSSARYQELGVTKIAVIFDNELKVNGKAYQNPMRVNNSDCALIIKIKPQLVATNLTPAHEYFHLIQYGYSMFNAPWYSEGTARLAMRIIQPKSEITNVDDLFLKNIQKDQLFNSSYNAVKTWRNIAVNCQYQSANVELPDHLTKITYTNGLPVIKNSELYISDYLLDLHQHLEKESHNIAELNGFSRYNWPKNEQINYSYNDRIWKIAIRKCNMDSVKHTNNDF
jgi:hypothetical protein